MTMKPEDVALEGVQAASDVKGLNKVPASRTGRIRMKYKPLNDRNAKFPISRLPFVSKKGHWDVPHLDGYGAGCDFGERAATAYIKALRETDDVNLLGGTLQSVVFSILESGSEPGDLGHRGAIVGFFSTLDYWLHASARNLGRNLDRLSEKELAKQMANAANSRGTDSLVPSNDWD